MVKVMFKLRCTGITQWCSNNASGVWGSGLQPSGGSLCPSGCRYVSAWEWSRDGLRISLPLREWCASRASTSEITRNKAIGES